MAVGAHSAPVTRASSGNIPRLSTTRRNFLGAVAIAPAAIGIPASAASRASADHLKWEQLLAAFKRAKAAVERFEADTYWPTMKKLGELSGPTPATKVEIGSTSGSVATFTVWQADWYEDARWFEPVRAARREYDAYFARVGRLEEETGFSAASDTMQRLDTLEGQARDALMAHPAPDAQALAIKLKLALEPGEFEPCYYDALAADAERLSE